MAPSCILVVDDDHKIRTLTTQFLRENGFDAHPAATTAEARSHLAHKDVHLIVLDIMMPGEDGLTFIHNLRQNKSEVPILLLTARDQVEDRIDGLNQGADDYLTKPFEPRELLARIRAVIRRHLPFPQVDLSWLSLGPFSFDPQSGLLKKGDEDVFLTSTEMVVLKTLAQAPRQPFAREDLAQRIGHRISNRSVDVQITRLRRKLKDDSRHPRYLRTIRHIGYSLYPDPSL